MVTKKPKQYDATKAIEDGFKFNTVVDSKSLTLDGIMVNVIPGWYAALDKSGDIHMFSQHPRFDTRLSRWLPKRATCVAVLIDNTYVDPDTYKSVIVKADKLESSCHTLTDREIRYLILKDASDNQHFTLDSITEYAATKAVKQEAEVRDCDYRKVKSNTLYSHVYVFY